ncbi:hypothetical protein I4U23_022282 [Adineta vaga]|nr:hypothetical protein I4U23_022282 [Adineta vaga]
MVIMEDETYQSTANRHRHHHHSHNTTSSRPIRIIHVSIRPKSKISPTNKSTMPTLNNHHHHQLPSFSRYHDVSHSSTRLTNVQQPHLSRLDYNSNRMASKFNNYFATIKNSSKATETNIFHLNPSGYFDRKKTSKCNKRCIAISLVIGLLRLVSSIIIPSVVLTRPKTTYPSTTTVSSTSSTSTSSTSTTTTTTSSALPAQCFSYSNNSDSTRNVGYSSSSSCDQSVFGSTGKWIRFLSPAGTAIITYNPGYNYCGTNAPGWFKDSYPTLAGNTVNGTVCYYWSGNTCNWSNSISITNCDTFYVFLLIDVPTCSLRYCTA